MDAITARIHRAGPIDFAEFMELALYSDSGFYGGGGGPGRRGADFLTSPEIGPLFGAVVANALDRWWTKLDQPDPFVVVEAGAGRGVLAASILGAQPACAPALRYVMAERAAPARAAASDVLAITPAAVALAGEGHGGGPIVTVLDDLPTGPFVGVIVANELLDNLPVRLLERTVEGWAEVLVGLDESETVFVEVLVPADDDAAARATALTRDPPSGARVPLHDAAIAWLARARRSLEGGRVVAFDYGVHRTDELTQRDWSDWLRTYQAQGRGGAPLARAGEQDVTCEVAFDQLAPDSLTPQADWLAAHGIASLVDEARATWTERAAIGDLVALKARSRVGEADALLDEEGLGAFLVAEWIV
ncbi:MAG TPA: SAM-dependent methyltransferase [Acidimicrobiales bacterium]|nr:SAM-dependent methyltransferase [Acidimicrobiales bacterium]